MPSAVHVCACALLCASWLFWVLHRASRVTTTRRFRGLDGALECYFKPLASKECQTQPGCAPAQHKSGAQHKRRKVAQAQEGAPRSSLRGATPAPPPHPPPGQHPWLSRLALAPYPAQRPQKQRAMCAERCAVRPQPAACRRSARLRRTARALRTEAWRDLLQGRLRALGRRGYNKKRAAYTLPKGNKAGAPDCMLGSKCAAQLRTMPFCIAAVSLLCHFGVALCHPGVAWCTMLCRTLCRLAQVPGRVRLVPRASPLRGSRPLLVARAAAGRPHRSKRRGAMPEKTINGNGRSAAAVEEQPARRPASQAAASACSWAPSFSPSWVFLSPQQGFLSPPQGFLSPPGWLLLAEVACQHAWL